MIVDCQQLARAYRVPLDFRRVLILVFDISSVVLLEYTRGTLILAIGYGCSHSSTRIINSSRGCFWRRCVSPNNRKVRLSGSGLVKHWSLGLKCWCWCLRVLILISLYILSSFIILLLCRHFLIFPPILPRNRCSNSHGPVLAAIGVSRRTLATSKATPANLITNNRFWDQRWFSGVLLVCVSPYYLTVQ